MPPLQAVSLDFLGVPGSAAGNRTRELLAEHGFPADKRLGACVVDGRSVWADGAAPGALLAAIQKQVRQPERTNETRHSNWYFDNLRSHCFSFRSWFTGD